MIRNSLETIEYVDNCKNIVIYCYKEKYKGDNLRSKNLWIVLRRLLQIVGPDGSNSIEKKYRRKVVLKTLNKMTSDSYIESSISWEEFTCLNNMIDELNMDEIEQETYKEMGCICCKWC